MTEALAWFRTKDDLGDDVLHCSVADEVSPGEILTIDGKPYFILASGACRDLRSGNTGAYTLALREPTKQELEA